MKHSIWIMCAAAMIARGQDVVGMGNFSHVVTNLDKSLEFYQGVLGLQPTAPAAPFDGNPAIQKLGNTPGSQSRYVLLSVPGSAVGVELLEYKDVDRKPAHPRFQDPGVGNLTLRVTDFDGVVARAKKAGVHVLTAGGGPVTFRGGKIIFMQDDDGFVVEMSQGAMPGGGFEAVMNDAEQTAKAYRAFGLDPTAPEPFNNDKTMTDTAGTPGASFRHIRAPLPSSPPGGPMAAIGFIEFKDIDRKPMHTRVQDPGTAMLQLNVRDVTSLLPKLKAAGFEIVSTGGQPVEVFGTKIAVVRDLNNLFLELIEQKTR